jgi:hypothetical protein
VAEIIGSLVPEDDYTHPLGSESNFNESMYFNFFDSERGIGGFVRIGNRANEGRAETTVTVYLPDGRVLFSFKRPQIANNDAFDCGGLRFEVIEPTQSLRTVYEGSVLELTDPRKMADPRRAFVESPKKKIALELVHEAVGPMYGGSKARGEHDRPPEEQFASAHYEQHMEVRGRLSIEGEGFEIHGYGLRDHSWGPRYWQAIESYEWLTMNFGPDLGAMISIVRRDADHQKKGGVIVRDGKLELVVEAEIRGEFEDNGLYHRKVFVDAKTASGDTIEITGEVKGFIPLRNRREGLVTHIGEGMTEWHFGDRVGYGLSEFLRQVR